jgi:hypothetical protein
MNPRTARSPKKSMTIRLAAMGAVLVATLAGAAPAMAMQPPEPHGGGTVETSDPLVNGSVDPTSAALGALGGIAVAGAGLAFGLGVQRRRGRSASDPL